MFRPPKIKKLKKIKYVHKLQILQTHRYSLRPGSYPGQEAQVQAAGDLQQLQGLGGRAEGKGDLEAVVRVKHQLGGAVTILEHRLQQGAHGNQSG